MYLTQKAIATYYDRLKSRAKTNFARGRFEKCLEYINTAAEAAYLINWIYRDDDLEDMLAGISEASIVRKSHYTPCEKRCVLYVARLMDNRGIIQQYLRALMAYADRLLVITENPNSPEATETLAEIEENHSVELFVVPQNTDLKSRAQLLYDKITSFRTERLFMHLWPWSGFAVSVFDALPESIRRYQINLTDHAFWLGTRCTDYTLEFRSYGCTVSEEKRGISRERLLLHPYYPIMSRHLFEGLPEGCRGKTILFSGGGLYKIYGENDTYFKIVKHILDKFPQIVLIYAGLGDPVPFENFIAENGFKDRIFLLGFRKDIAALFRHCDIYLNTYPASGGLMCQYAAILGKPILAYQRPDRQAHFIEQTVCITQNCRITNTDLEELLQEAEHLILDSRYREQRGREMQACMISQERFDTDFAELISTHRSSYRQEKVDIDYNAFAQRYIDKENSYTPSFKALLVKRLRLKTIVLCPRIFLWFIGWCITGGFFKYLRREN